MTAMHYRRLSHVILPCIGISMTVGLLVQMIKVNILHNSSTRLLRLKTYTANTFVRNRTAVKEMPLFYRNGTADNEMLPCRQVMPKCIIAGVMKCGTQALTDFLTIHPDVAMKRDERTVQFFSTFYDNGYEWYRQHMSCSLPGQVTIEKTPQYFRNPLAPKRIHDTDKDMKILLIVRDPVTRAVSHYHQLQHSNQPLIKGNGSFEAQILNSNGDINTTSPVLIGSLYSIPLKKWLKYFPLENIHIVDGDVFAQDIVIEYRKVERFLKLRRSVLSDTFVFDDEKGFFCIQGPAPARHHICLSKGKGRKHHSVDQPTREKMKAFFRPYNDEFMKLVGQEFDWND